MQRPTYSPWCKWIAKWRNTSKHVQHFSHFLLAPSFPGFPHKNNPFLHKLRSYCPKGKGWGIIFKRRKGVGEWDKLRRDNTAGHKQPRRFLECAGDNFQVIEEPTRRAAVLGLVLTNKARGECEAQVQSWLQWPWNSGGKRSLGQQAGRTIHCPELQESRLQSLHGSAW